MYECIKADKGVCPICDSWDIDYDGSESDGECISDTAVCNNCGVHFDEVSQIVYSSSVINQDLKELLKDNHEELLITPKIERQEELTKIIAKIENKIKELSGENNEAQ